MNDNELYHYGVLGMRWGVHNAETARRYGESAGSTLKKTGKTSFEAGKAAVTKYRNHVAEKKRIEASKTEAQKLSEARARMTRRQARADERRARKNVRNMSTEELEARISRLEKEKKLRELTEASQNKTLTSNWGKNHIRKMIEKHSDAFITDVRKSLIPFSSDNAKREQQVREAVAKAEQQEAKAKAEKAKADQEQYKADQARAEAERAAEKLRQTQLKNAKKSKK